MEEIKPLFRLNLLLQFLDNHFIKKMQPSISLIPLKNSIKNSQNNKPMRKISYLILIAMLALFSCKPAPKQVVNEDVKIEQEVDSLLGKMTLKEKVSLLHGNSKFTTAAIERLGIPEWHLSDGPHGVREEIKRDSWEPAGWTNDSSSYFPTGTALAATWNPELAHEEGVALGEEARYRGKDVLLGPGINIHRTPLCGRNFEYMSEDPYLISQMCVPVIQGIQSRDVAACIKHYIANNQEIDRGTVDVEMSDRAFHEIYLPGFKAAVEKGGVYTLMGAYNKFHGDWCCENHFLMTDILRDELGFKGVAMSDWAAVHNTVKTANAGLDLEMGTDSAYNRYYFADKLIDAVNKGEVTEATVDQKVKHILGVMLKTKVIGPDKDKRAKGSFVTPEHKKAAYNVASESIVLLKNDDQVLPVHVENFKSIAVIGDNATRKHAAGGFSSGLKAKYEITPLAGLQNKVGDQIKLNVAQGYEKNSELKYDKGLVFDVDKAKDKKLLNEAVKAAKSSDVAIIFGGLNHDYDTEAFDRPDMELPYSQEKLILAVAAANPNTILVLSAGSPLDLSRVKDKVKAIVWGWLNGMENGNALADVLTGKVNPSGKMPFTIPVKLDDSPAHAMGNYPGKDLKVNYEEGILVGYRWYDTKKIAPLFPFGYGLSYTTFEYSDLKTDQTNYPKDGTIKVSFNLKNTGEVAGAETAQLYVSDPECSVMRPTKELKGFKKVFLQPGESKTVELSVPVSSLAFYSEKDNGWVVEPGSFILQVNSSSADNRLKETINID